MLKPTLLANALSCLVFGLIFVLAPAQTAGFLGTAPVWLVLALGLGLIVNGGHLLWVARAAFPRRREILYFVLGDGLWVLGTIILLAGGLWITTAAGTVLAVLVALWVGLCGFLQWRYAPSA